MSLHPEPIGEIPGETARIARAAFPKGTLVTRLRDEFSIIYQVGAVPLMLRLVRRGTHRGKLRSARFLLRLLGDRLGRVRVLLDAWFMRGRLIVPAVADGHTVIGRVRRDLALYAVPGRLGGGARAAAQVRRADDAGEDRGAAGPPQRADPVRQARGRAVPHLPGRARFLKGRVVRAVWVQLERPDRRGEPTEERLLICTDPDLPATEIITGYAKRWSVEPLFAAMKHGWGLKDAWQQSRQVLMRWVTPGGGLRAQPDAGLHRPGPHPRPRRSRALAAARHAHRRADPGGLRPDFARGRPARLHARDLAKIGPANQPPRRETGVRRHQSRLNQQSGRHHADHDTAVHCRRQVRLPVNFSYAQKKPRFFSGLFLLQNS